MESKVLVKTYGFFGDIIFASSLAEELKQEYSLVTFLIGFPQVKSLLLNNPFIDEVIVSSIPSPTPFIPNLNLNVYNRVIELSPLFFETPPVVEYKIKNKFKNISPEYKVYTNFEYDNKVQELMTQTLDRSKKTLAFLSNWEEKTFGFTQEEYSKGIDVPNLGYGGRRRNISFILSKLNPHFNLLEVGMKGGTSQQSTSKISDNDTKSLLFEASILKYCDAFIGAEGGLANIAAGVGTPTIITGDFIHQLYGWNGVIKKLKEPKLGPKYYFNNKHITLDPFISDIEIVEYITKHI